MMGAHNVHFFELETDGALDLLEDSLFDALCEAGCDDALLGHHRLDFAREAVSWDEALKSARADAESVPGVRVVSVRINAEDIEPAPRKRSAQKRTPSRRGRHSAAAV